MAESSREAWGAAVVAGRTLCTQPSGSGRGRLGLCPLTEPRPQCGGSPGAPWFASADASGPQFPVEWVLGAVPGEAQLSSPSLLQVLVAPPSSSTQQEVCLAAEAVNLVVFCASLDRQRC